MKEKESTVLRAFITEAWTLLTQQASTTLIKEYFIYSYTGTVYSLDYIAYVVLSENFGKRYIQRFTSGHRSPPTVKENLSLPHTKKRNKIRYHISKQKPRSTAFPVAFYHWHSQK